MIRPWLTGKIIGAIEILVSFLLQPFSRARRLQQYANRGYLLFGILLASAAWLFWDYLNVTLVTTPLSLREFLHDVAGITGPEGIPRWVVILIFYAVIGARRTWRTSVGEVVADGFFGVINFAILVGEFCLEHRWVSYFAMIALIILLTAGFIRDAQASKRAEVLRSNFAHWVKEVETFVEKGPLTKVEADKYGGLQSRWDPEFDQLLTLPDHYTHPAHCLNRVLETLYSEKTDFTLEKVLILKVRELDQLIRDCKSRPLDEMSPTELQVWALINILMGRVYNRLSKGGEEPSHLIKAKFYFEKPDLTRFDDPDATKRYRSHVSNGLGTVFANAFSSYESNKGNADFKQTFPDRNQCARFAYEAYQKAGEGFEDCSFQCRRRLNNLTDLLVRIGADYMNLTRPLPSPLDKLVRDRETTANEIEGRVQEMMRCGEIEPFVPFVTAAQAFVISAKLKSEAGLAVTDEIETAARYLRLAYSFERDSYSRKQIMSSFCFVIKDRKLDRTFRDAFVKGFGGLPAPDLESLTTLIEQSCQ